MRTKVNSRSMSLSNGSATADRTMSVTFEQSLTRKTPQKVLLHLLDGNSLYLTEIRGELQHERQ
jgi:hypothetical protein